MKGNRRADTRPEVALRRALHARGLRFRKDYLLPVHGARAVRADIVFTRARIAVFLDGCFWHGCPEHGRVPSTNPQYWPEKLRRNRERDIQVSAALTADDWRVIRVWEHEPVHAAVSQIEDVLSAMR